MPKNGARMLPRTDASLTTSLCQFLPKRSRFFHRRVLLCIAQKDKLTDRQGTAETETG